MVDFTLSLETFQIRNRAANSRLIQRGIFANVRRDCNTYTSIERRLDAIIDNLKRISVQQFEIKFGIFTIIMIKEKSLFSKCVAGIFIIQFLTTFQSNLAFTLSRIFNRSRRTYYDTLCNVFISFKFALSGTMSLFYATKIDNFLSHRLLPVRLL